MPDKNGKPWAAVADTKRGSVLIPDNGFDCLENMAAVTVEEDEDGLYVRCAKGQHYLDGQLSEDGAEYVGLWPAIITDGSAS